MTDITRKKHTGEPGNGGQFGAKTNSEGEVSLNAGVAGRRLGRLGDAVESLRHLKRQFALDAVRDVTNTGCPEASHIIVERSDGAVEVHLTSADGARQQLSPEGLQATRDAAEHLDDGTYVLRPTSPERIEEINAVLENQYADDQTISEYAGEAISLSIRDAHPEATALVLEDLGDETPHYLASVVQDSSGQALVDYAGSPQHGAYDDLNSWTPLLVEDHLRTETVSSGFRRVVFDLTKSGDPVRYPR